MLKGILLLFLLFSCLGWPQTTSTSSVAPVTIAVRPARPLIEHGGTLQLLNFDFYLENTGGKNLHLNRIQVAVWGKGGRLVLRRELDENGHPSGMTTIAERDIPKGGHIAIFNPFYEFGPEVQLEKMSYSFFFNDVGYKTATPLDFEYSAEVTVTPIDFVGKTALLLPLRQRSIIFDGHDFYSHHRRQSPADSNFERLKMWGNPVRYAYDFCPVNEMGEMYKDSPYNKENWYGYGAPIYAPAEGVVVDAVNDVPENDFTGKEVVYAEIPESQIYKILGGNYVVIDHGKGEFSYFAHMKTGSVRVKAGDRVKQGEQIGQLGFAGDAFIPHLHYMLMDNADILKAESTPSYFQKFRRILGSTTEEVSKGQIDTGDIIESDQR
jgi:Peptidase family M23